ncbi:MAG: DUF4249 family protein [Bacteroidota bacterium]
MKSLLHFAAYFSVSLGCLLMFSACDDELEVTAPEKPILAIYGILDPTAETQYVRVAEGFLTEEDAIEFAALNDLSLPNAQVFMTNEVNNFQTDTIYFSRVDTSKEPGAFNRDYTVFATSAAVQAGETYTLHVNVTDPADLSATATTTIPFETNLFEPRDSVQAFGNQFDWSEVNFATNTQLELEWRRSRESGAEPEQVAAGFEVSAFIEVGIRLPNGDTLFQPPARFGPIGPITESRCISGNDATICYPIAGPNVLSQWTTQFPDDLLGGRLVFEDFVKSEAVYFRIASLDRELLNYQNVNNPAFEDFSTVNFEYTNVSVEGEGIGVGVFGSRNTETQYVRIAPCTQYNLRLNNQPQGADCQDVLVD